MCSPAQGGQYSTPEVLNLAVQEVHILYGSLSRSRVRGSFELIDQRICGQVRRIASVVQMLNCGMGWWAESGKCL